MLNIISFNVKGIAEKNKRRQIFDFNADISLLQETHSSNKISKILQNEWGGGKILYSHGETNARGVAILFKHGNNYKIHKVYCDLAGRVLIIDVSLNENRVAIYNLYAPNDDKPVFYKCFREPRFV